MSLFSKIMGKKKTTVTSNQRDEVFYPGTNDDQDMYFKEDFEEKPKKKAPAKKQTVESEGKKSEPKKKPTVKKAKIEEKETKVKAETKKASPAPVKSPTKKATATVSSAKANVSDKKPSATKKADPKTEVKSTKSPAPKKAESKTAKTVVTEKKAATAKSAPVQKSTKVEKVAATKKDNKPAKATPVAPGDVKSSKTGRFEIKKAKDGRYVFNLYAPNHIIVATSQVYSSTSAALNGIQSIIANAEKAPVEDNTLKNPTKQSFPKWEMYIDKGGEYRFRLYATNGNCVVHSQGYKQKSSCKNGIESIIRCSRNAEIDKAYLNKE